MDQKKDEKSARKAAKKAEKLAKFQKKQEIQQSATQSHRDSTQTKRKEQQTDAYDPGVIEAKWIEYWKSNSTFTPKQKQGARIFSMCVPPPNVTGTLHIGHAMMIAIEDSIVRFKRLTGHEVLYLPGLDHAGISTQGVVMRHIGKVDRETFMEKAHEWSEKYGNRICEQFDRMGCSVDYSRKVFTLDPSVSRSVNRAFVQLYNRGLIYRENKLVNWCGKLQTTLSDLEVNYKDVSGGSTLHIDGGEYRFGVMYYVKYQLAKTPESPVSTAFVVVGTTRPETILGDTALCANPTDTRFDDLEAAVDSGEFPDPMNVCSKEEEQIERRIEEIELSQELKAERRNKYKREIGAKKTAESAHKAKTAVCAVNPLTRERIPIIFDSNADKSFGTGILKVTPAHDITDYQLGKAHDLKVTTVFTEQNTISVSGKYEGLSRFEARKKIVADLRASGDLIKEELHDQVLPFCAKSGDIVEPRLKEQWWMNCKGMAERAAEAVKSGEIKLFPREAHAVWFRWLDGIKDWCLSRQLWWGHRVPAYRAFKDDGTFEWVIAEDAKTAEAQAQERGYNRMEQDEDVLDTWFSSGLWPFSTLGWPDETSDFKRYFPNTMLETGSDILFFWVARMVMLSYELCNQPPFRTILLHGIVRDAHGRKMSKSLGNVIDPINVIEGISLEEMIAGLKKGNLDPREVQRAADAFCKDFPAGIPKCGADALRFALLSYTNGTKDVNLDVLRVQGYSRLCNKLYNAFKYVSRFGEAAPGDPVLRRSRHRWIFEKLNECIRAIHSCFETYSFMQATQCIHSFFLYDFCDVFIEVTKGVSETQEEAGVLRSVFLSILTLFNPFMPFITEELHSRLTGTCISSFPLPFQGDLSNSFGDVLGLARLHRGTSLVVEETPDVADLQKLLRAEVKVVDKLTEFQEFGSIRYSIL